MNLKTISGFRNTDEAARFASAIAFRAQGFSYAPEPAAEARHQPLPAATAH